MEGHLATAHLRGNVAMIGSQVRTGGLAMVEIRCFLQWKPGLPPTAAGVMHALELILIGIAIDIMIKIEGVFSHKRKPLDIAPLTAAALSIQAVMGVEMVGFLPRKPLLPITRASYR